MTVWTIFIDAEPMKGWKHDCYIAKIPKNPSIQGTLPTPPKLIANGLPPAGSYKPLSVKKQIWHKLKLKTICAKNNCTK